LSADDLPIYARRMGGMDAIAADLDKAMVPPRSRLGSRLRRFRGRWRRPVRGRVLGGAGQAMMVAPE
jgi:hypothetical protein